MVKFTEEPVRTRKGAPRVHIPDEIAQWCEHTYTKGVSCEVPIGPDDEETPMILRALRIYATRQNKAISYQFITDNGSTFLRFRMRDKLVMKKAELPKEK